MAAEVARPEESPELARRSQVRHLLAQYAADRDETVREQLVQLNAGLARAIARRFAHRGEPLEDLEQVGFLGLIQAIERFDLSRETEFTSFATPTIMGEIRRHFRECSWSVRVPRRLQESYLRAMRAEDQLTQELGRAPSVAEIATRIDLDPDELLAALEVSPARRALSLDAAVGGPDHADGTALGERLGGPDADLARSEARVLVGQAMAGLSPRERHVMALRFVEQLSQREVARRLGVTQVHVCRLQRAALERMRRDLGGAGETQAVPRWIRMDAVCARAEAPHHRSAPDATLADLTESIRRRGILRPLVVQETVDRGYEILAGRRRWMVAGLLGMRTVPALVVPADQHGAAIWSLTETIQQEDVHALERAGALRDLRARLGSSSWDEVGWVVGLTRRHIHHLLNVTLLPSEMQEAVRTGELSEKHARALVLLRAAPADQAELWQRVRSQRLSGAATLRLARALRTLEMELVGLPEVSTTLATARCA
jgi:RNA polymerase sigma-B factor